jgi:hypothetical protein
MQIHVPSTEQGEPGVWAAEADVPVEAAEEIVVDGREVAVVVGMDTTAVVLGREMDVGREVEEVVGTVAKIPPGSELDLWVVRV